MPITGSTEKYWDLSKGSGGRIGFKQTRPLRAPLPFKEYELFSNFSNGSGLPATASQNGLVDQRAYNGAFAKYQGKLMGEYSASMGATLAETKKSQSMVSARLLQLVSLVRAARRRDPRLVYDTLRDVVGSRGSDLKAYTRRGFSASTRSLANVTLEFNFGWAPLVADVNSGMQVLCNPTALKHVDGRPIVGSDKAQYTFIRNRRVGDSSDPIQQEINVTLDVKARVAARVRVDNPNLFLLNQLGLVNPLAVLYEVTPWSFLLGWCSNIDTIVGSYTRNVGLDAFEGYHTFSRTSVGTLLQFDSPWAEQPWYNDNGWGRYHERKLGILEPTFEFRFNVPSLTRIANALSLLRQALKR